MLSFESDYIAGAHPEILRRLAETNFEALPGYGADLYCERAKEKIRRACGLPGAQVEFLVGGTQTNAIVISTMLRDYEGVIAAKTGHVNTHESGAIEYTGHKVLELPGLPGGASVSSGGNAAAEGKIDPAALQRYVAGFYADENYEHMVFPGMVYISHPTEYGTLYTKRELEEIAAVCRNYGMILYVDGARLGYGLASSTSDVTLPELAALCDVFYIGGTKVGALCGEAVVFTRHNRPAHFMTSVKKRGALLAKGRLLGIQFDALFSSTADRAEKNDNEARSDMIDTAMPPGGDDRNEILYYRISRHAIDMSEKMKDLFHRCGIPFYLKTPTNQQFMLLENARMEKLKQEVAFSFWEKYDETRTVVRFATSWSTTREDLDALERILKRN